ncbi:DNA-binding pseudobarrel domain-containing protein [Tanacetum coccineum]
MYNLSVIKCPTHQLASVRKTDEGPLELLPCQLPLKELSLGSFTLPYTIGSLNLYAMANLGASANIMPRSMFNHLRLTNLKETNMLVEMADMTKKAPIGIVENILVKIDKFLLPLDFMIIDPNETMIFGKPFLATIHARIYVFNREISLGFGKFGGKAKIVEPDMTASRLHYCKPLQEFSNKTFKLLPTYDPSIRECNGGDKIYGLDEQGALKQWHCYLDKIKHTNVSKVVKSMVLNEWILDSFYVESDFAGIRNDPYLRNLEEYKVVFDNEIEQLTNEYELMIGKKGYILDDIWEKCEQVHGGTMYSWHDEGSEEEERWESSLDEKYYDPP